MQWRLPLAAAVLTAGLAACGQVSPADTRSTATGIPPPTTSGTANLNWTPVTQNTDGTPATDLAGYQIHYGTSPAALDSTITEADPTETSYVVTNLSPGTWYFAVAAYASDGTAGVMSNVASKTIN